MKRRQRWIILVSIALASGSPCGKAAADDANDPPGDAVRVHLPREVTVQNALLDLGQVTVVTGAGPLVTAAGGVRLGRFSVPGQTIVLDRGTILSRLASQGIPSEKVTLTGAESVTIRRRQQIISGDEFLSFAQLFLRQNPPGGVACEGAASAKPKDLALSDEPRNMQLVPRFVENGAAGFVTVQIAVVADGKEVGSRTVSLRLRYRSHRAVALQEIDEGVTLSPENVKVEEAVSDRAETGWKSPYGLVALRKVPAGSEIREDMVDAPQPPLLIRRNETVVIRIERPGFVVTAVGLALQEGRNGQIVKVRNADSHRVIVCKVNADGTVEPVL